MSLVSVIVPTYNRAKLLGTRCLPSIIAQTHRALDIHVIGDGTDDETVELMLGIMPLDSRIRFTNLPHQAYPDDPGQAWCVLGLEARNYGLDSAVGRYVTCLNDDDAWEPDAVERLLLLVESAPNDFAYGISVYHWPDGHRQTAGQWPPGMGAFCDGAWLMKHDLGYRFDPACIERGLPEDGDLWTRMWIEDKVSFAFLPRIVHHYYPNPR